MKRPITTLFMLESLDGKISSGSTDELDADKDFCRIDGVKESFVYGKPENDNINDLKLCVKIVYNPDLIKDIYKISDEEKIKEILWEKIKEINKTMPPYKYIKELIITDEELIKTTTLKIKRHEEMKKIENLE